MRWEDLLLDTSRVGTPLLRPIEALLEHQRRTWQAFREGEASLQTLRVKEIARGSARIIVQANPGRRDSVHARVDPLAVSQRPCLLCPGNLPPEERGVGYGDLVLLPNPHPILARHLTIPTRRHVPQQIAGRLGSVLELARDIGPDMLLVYNGPRCGASAPDHFHFQAGSTARVPLLEEASEIGDVDGITAYASLGRRILLLRSRDAVEAEKLLHRALHALTVLGGGGEEPLFNLIAVHRDQGYTGFFFPRSKHRPDCYYADPDARVSVSPAALEMAGIIVVADLEQFDRVDEKTVLSIYEEVSLGEERFQRLVQALT